MPAKHFWLTPEAEAQLEALRRAWGTGISETVRRALEIATQQEDKAS